MKKLFLIITIFTAIIIDMTIIEPNMLVTKYEKLYLPNWSENLDGYKIGVVSDLHIGTHFVNLNKLKNIVHIINDNNPDLVVLLGDLDGVSISNSGYKNEDISKILSEFKGKNGVISIMGNHDYEPQNIVKDILKQSNIKLLENDEIIITKDNGALRIYGMKDLWHYKSNPKFLIKQKQNMPTIVLSHNPDLFNNMPEFVSLTLSGHTHGGEIFFPFFGSPCVPSKFGQRYRKGYIIENGKHLYVSGGIASLSRMRLLNPPEISILTLYQEQSKQKDTKVLKGTNKHLAHEIKRKFNLDNSKLYLKFLHIFQKIQ